MLRNLQPGKQAIFPALKPRHEMIRETMKTMWSFWRKLDRQEDHTGTELHCIIYKEHFPGPCHLLFCLSFSGAETPQGLTFGRTRDVEKRLQSVLADIVDSRAIWLRGPRILLPEMTRLLCLQPKDTKHEMQRTVLFELSVFGQGRTKRRTAHDIKHENQQIFYKIPIKLSSLALSQSIN